VWVGLAKQWEETAANVNVNGCGWVRGWGKPWKGEMDEGSELRAKEGDINGERECKRVQRGLTKAAEGNETSRRGRSNGGVMQGER
jgi:hypothetical protein